MRTWKFLLPVLCAGCLLAPAIASAAFMHIVAPGESLSSVAAADGLTVGQLAAANGLSPNASLVSGTSIAIPPQGAVAAAPVAAPSATDTDGDDDGDAPAASPTTAAAPAATAPSSAGGYLVQPGDTLSSIAARYGLTVGQLAAVNGMSASGVLEAGRTISVGGAPAAPAPVATAAATATPVAAPASGGAQPTSQFVTPSEVGAIAAANGVPASLAEAIGYQESGFNNGAVSSSGATGVMQIEPGTWNYIGSTLGGSQLSPASATDNIRGGVMYLHSLLNATGGDPAQAAAAYYQGLGSLQQHGMYSDTQQYVNDVMALQQRFGGG